ncbi:MAG: ArsR/SmtB family transcription factor [Promethearchaeota archaeon]
MINIREERKSEIMESLKSCINLQEININDYFQNLRDKGRFLKESKIIQDLSKFFNALGNENRLSILNILNERDYCVCELEAILDKSQSSISHHLKILEDVGLIEGVKKGYFTHYIIKKNKLEEYWSLFNDTFFKK